MGRKALKLEKIEDKQKRTVTFCKRSKGLFKKAKSLCELYPNLQIAVLTFSPIAGVPYTWASSSTTADSSSSSSSFDAIVDRFLLGNNTNATTNGTIGNINSNTTTTAMMDPIGDHHRKQKKRKISDVGLGLCEQEEEEEEHKKRKNEGFLGFLEEEENHTKLEEQERQELATTSSYSSVILDAQIDGGAGDDEHHGDEEDEKKLEEEDNMKREGFWLLDDEITANLEEDELGPACWFTVEELMSLEDGMEELEQLEHNGDEDCNKLNLREGDRHSCFSIDVLDYL